MSFTQSKFWLALLYLHVLGFWFLILIVGQGGGAIGPNVHSENILKVKLGMTEDEVTAILGPPQKIEMADGWLAKAHQPWVRERTGEERFVYHDKPDVSQSPRWYPALWIRFRDGRVEEVYAKKYFLWGVDDEAVYALSQSDPKPWISDQFAKTFPKHSSSYSLVKP